MDIPPPIQCFIETTNRGDSAALLTCFTSDAYGARAGQRGVRCNGDTDSTIAPSEGAHEAVSELLQVAAALTRAAVEDQVSVLATVVRTEGSTYRRIGARLVTLADSSHVGAVSAGCIEMTRSRVR